MLLLVYFGHNFIKWSIIIKTVIYETIFKFFSLVLKVMRNEFWEKSRIRSFMENNYLSKYVKLIDG